MPKQTPDVVVVGAATRDLTDADPRGWQLGGGVTFGALALARLGLRTGVVLGLDSEAATAKELELLHQAGVEVITVPLDSGPVFTNTETLAGRIQTLSATSDPVLVSATPDAWRAAPAWVFAPIASELPDEWADVPHTEACVAFAWQGILRNLVPGKQITPAEPSPSSFLRRADIVAVSRNDFVTDLTLEEVGAFLGSRCDLLLTAGLMGGMLLQYEDGQVISSRGYPSVPSVAEIDAVGAGDTMLAGVVAARLAGGPEARRSGHDLRVGAAAASLLVEGPGLNSVPTLAQLQERLGSPD